MTAQDSDHYGYKIFHIFIISHLTGLQANQLDGGSSGIDQHCHPNNFTAFPNAVGGVGYSGCKDGTARVFVEVIPGGDPSEPWGVLDLNCLQEP